MALSSPGSRLSASAPRSRRSSACTSALDQALARLVGRVRADARHAGCPSTLIRATSSRARERLLHSVAPRARVEDAHVQRALEHRRRLHPGARVERDLRRDPLRVERADDQRVDAVLRAERARPPRGRSRSRRPAPAAGAGRRARAPGCRAAPTAGRRGSRGSPRRRSRPTAPLSNSTRPSVPKRDRSTRGGSRTAGAAGVCEQATASRGQRGERG